MKAGWEIKPLAKLSKLFADGDWIESKDQSTDGVRLVQTGNVGEGFFKDRGEKARYISKETFVRLRCTAIFEGDCLISRLPDPVGRSCLLPDTGEPMITAVDCTIVRFDDSQLLPKFFVYFTQSSDYLNNVDKETSGTTRKRISRSKLGEIPIPVPPIQEQQRIEAILDQAFEGIAKARANAEQNLQNARALFESHLQSVFNHRGEAWSEKRLDKVAKVVSGYSFKSSDFSSTNQIKTIKITNVGVKEFVDDFDSLLPISFKNKYDAFTVNSGSIVIALTRTIIQSGLKVAVVPNTYDGALLNQRVAAVIANCEYALASYLYLYLSTKQVEQYVINHVNTLMQPNLSINDLKALSIPLPAIVEQKKIVRDLETLSQETKRLEALYQRKIALLDELKKSLLQQAFAGEL